MASTQSFPMFFTDYSARFEALEGSSVTVTMTIFKWVVEGDNDVQLVFDVVSQFLSEVKTAQAERVLQAFRAQTRLKGDATHCLRGHEYSYTALRGGRVRRICNACERLQDRRERARRGIAPRAFKNISRRYTA